MRLVIQRVSEASVLIEGRAPARIGRGFCVLLGVAPEDGGREVDVLADKLVNLRVFEDEGGKMNRSLIEVGGSLLVVSQFTLYADCRRGRRPSFTAAASPERGERIYDAFVDNLKQRGVEVETGEFGADMKVHIVNEGPVTIILDSQELNCK